MTRLPCGNCGALYTDHVDYHCLFAPTDFEFPCRNVFVKHGLEEFFRENLVGTPDTTESRAHMVSMANHLMDVHARLEREFYKPTAPCANCKSMYVDHVDHQCLFMPTKFAPMTPQQREQWAWTQSESPHTGRKLR